MSTQLPPLLEYRMQCTDTVQHYILANFQACQHGVERDHMQDIYIEMAMHANIL